MTTEEKIKQQYPDRKFTQKTEQGVLAELLAEKGIARFVEFYGTIEGDIFPGGVNEVSGTILTQDGRVFTYWLGWDPDKTAPDRTKGWYDLGENKFFEYKGKKLSYFREIPPEDGEYPKPDDSSFLAAKKKLGLA